MPRLNRSVLATSLPAEEILDVTIEVKDDTESAEVSVESGAIETEIVETNTYIESSIYNTVQTSTSDYRYLTNKPSINGTELIGNYTEIDPTVADWAKAETKPTYTAEEVGAISENNEMAFADVKAVWDTIFT